MLEDIASDAAYVEYTGLFVRKRDGKRFPLRVLFGSAGEGQGRVTPESAAELSRPVAKMVTLGSPARPAQVVTAMYEAEDEVAMLKSP